MGPQGRTASLWRNPELASLRGAVGTGEIAPRVLSRELKALAAAAGLIARKDYGLVPPKVEYRLTEGGGELRAHHRLDPRMGRAPSRRQPADLWPRATET